MEGVESAIIVRVRAQCAAILNRFRHGKDDPRIDAMRRYMNMSGNYDIDTDFVDLLLEKIIPESAKSFLDLGCASGNLLKEIKNTRAGSDTKGIDLNPKFVITANKEGIDCDVGFIDDELTINHLYDCVITNLTLDRVADPKKLIENVYSSTKEGGVFVIGTLLPIESHDARFTDGKTTEYTPQAKKLTKGRSEEADKADLLAYLKSNFNTNVSVERYPYRQKGKEIGNYYLLHATKTKTQAEAVDG